MTANVGQHTHNVHVFVTRGLCREIALLKNCVVYVFHQLCCILQQASQGTMDDLVTLLSDKLEYFSESTPALSPLQILSAQLQVYAAVGCYIFVTIVVFCVCCYVRSNHK